MLTEQEITRNKWAMENAIAQQTLEGLTVSAEVRADMLRVVHGEMTTDEVIANIKKRYENSEL